MDYTASNIKTNLYTAVMIIALFASAATGGAQSLWGKKYAMPRYEITPFTGYMLGGYLNVYQGYRRC